MISVVMPVYNEENNIQATLKVLKIVMDQVGEDYEIVIVDDKSSDNTLTLLRELKDSNLKVVANPTNTGPGGAFRTGFKNSSGDFIITLDCDLSFSADKIPELLRGLENADVVIGSQHIRGSKMVNVPMYRYLASKVCYMLDSMVLGLRLPSFSSFFIAYRSEVVKGLDYSCNSFDAQCEIVYKLAKKGYRIKGVPCELKWKDRKRKSSMRLWRELKNRIKLWKMLRGKVIEGEK